MRLENTLSNLSSAVQYHFSSKFELNRIKCDRRWWWQRQQQQISRTAHSIYRYNVLMRMLTRLFSLRRIKATVSSFRQHLGSKSRQSGQSDVVKSISLIAWITFHVIINNNWTQRKNIDKPNIVRRYVLPSYPLCRMMSCLLNVYFELIQLTCSAFDNPISFFASPRWWKQNSNVNARQFDKIILYSEIGPNRIHH